MDTEKGTVGVLPDLRSDEEKQADYLHEERVGSAVPADPFGNAKITESPYPYENQQGSSSCVAHGVGLGLAIERAKALGTYIRLGWLFNYRLRSNFGSEGMVISESCKLYKGKGAPLYDTAPDLATEEQANAMAITDAMTNEAQIFDNAEYYKVASGINDISVLGAIAQQGKAVPITIFATYSEWAKQYPTVDIPELNLSDPRTNVRHEVCILPYSGFTENGVRYLTVQDSAWFGGFKLRHLSEQFIEYRVTSAFYWDSVAMEATGIYPHYTFSKVLTVGTSSEEVRQLQLLLIGLGLLPADCATGYFGGRTLAGVRAFQETYASEILTPLGLAAPTRTWGSGCIKKANALCAH